METDQIIRGPSDNKLVTNRITQWWVWSSDSIGQEPGSSKCVVEESSTGYQAGADEFCLVPSKYRPMSLPRATTNSAKNPSTASIAIYSSDWKDTKSMDGLGGTRRDRADAGVSEACRFTALTDMTQLPHDPFSRAIVHSTVHSVGNSPVKPGEIAQSSHQTGKVTKGDTLGMPELLLRLWQEPCLTSIQGWHTQLTQSIICRI
ncbi:uncharacterized protein N7477_002871 [Penicillium maclennaniae]|uniref:uncharacterized protein n=1 Tax=Penicillium maclennaniae TaxID=1343394 RepID=UPI00254208BE|nr:uncharacterized protein N7477_002871 [Penicillium maclennaniae]KAJ5677238.1 hypothetical protein N7477_002871 [Penicillium maclennaniae]